MTARPHVVLIHGMYMTPLCWEAWVERFEAAGFPCSAPPWPGRERTVAELNAAHPDPAVGKLTLVDVVAAMRAHIATLEGPVAVVGHSLGGLVAQLLAQGERLHSVVAIDSAPPRGVLTASLPFLRANWGHANPFVPLGRPVRMSFERFQYAFVNGMEPEVQRAAYERYAVPESRRVPRQSLGRAGAIDFRGPHAPLLLIAGENDHLIPAALNRTNARRYRRSSSPIELRSFADRNHFLIGAPGFEEIADAAIDWIDSADARP